MKPWKYGNFIVSIAILTLLSGCQGFYEEALHLKDELIALDIKNIFSEAVEYSGYANEVGFSLDTPTKKEFEVNTMVTISGQVEKYTDLNIQSLWVTLEYEGEIQEPNTQQFDYYVPIENGQFSKEMKLHHGAGEYTVKIRVPSNIAEEENTYYDATIHKVTNLDEDVIRDVEYTWRAFTEEIILSPSLGLSDANGSIFVEGTVPVTYRGNQMMVSVEKADQSQRVFLPIKKGVFSGNVPLYFGEGYHRITVQIYDHEDNHYYQAASFYANNKSAQEFTDLEIYRDYLERGVTFIEPSWDTEKTQKEIAYRVVGEVDPTIERADEISHIIVMVSKKGEEDLEAGYLITVENGKFDGEVYFRFGPGAYEVSMNIPVPEMEDEESSMFYFSSLKYLQHEVIEIEDKRGVLPSRGIESDHPVIIAKAQEITEGITDEREIAKAVYRFVANHVAYDVQKLEEGTFSISDSALKALETGMGVCQDYAFLATALFRALGMEAHYVEGYAGERHAWVEVKVNGEWLEMDPTWGSGYIQNGVFVRHYTEAYFDPDPDFLAKTHRRDGILY